MHHVWLYISEGSQIRRVRQCGADFCGVPAQLGRGALSCVSGFWRVALIPIEPPGCHQKSATETQTHSPTKKERHKTPASDRSGIMRTMTVVFTQQRMLKVVCCRQENCFFYFIIWPPPVMKKKNVKRKELVLVQILQCNQWRATLPWRTIVLTPFSDEIPVDSQRTQEG